MEPELDDIENRIDKVESRLGQITKLVQANNVYLQKMRHAQLVARTFKIIYWVLVIGAAVGVFYFLQPYVDGLSHVLNSVKNILPYHGTTTASLPFFSHN